MSEHAEQVALFDVLAMHPECKWIHAVPNGFYSTPAQKAKMGYEGLRKGVWDIFVPYPRGKYHGMYVEMKYGKNKLTAEQVEFGAFVEAQGYKTFVAYGWFEAYTAIMDYLGLVPIMEG